MAVSDMVAEHTEVLNTQYLTIQPSGTDIWAIQNIYIPYGVECELYRTDGSSSVLITKLTQSLLSPYTLNVSNSIYFTIKNVSGGSAYLGYDGRVAKV